MRLFESRGYETPSHRLFMRNSVLFFDLLIYFPAAFLVICELFKSHNRANFETFFFLVVTPPSLVLIDHGHFQYNSISLGFTLLSVYFLLKNRDLWSSFWFVVALNYKQMSLYYSPAFFFYLFFKNFDRRNVM